MQQAVGMQQLVGHAASGGHAATGGHAASGGHAATDGHAPCGRHASGSRQAASRRHAESNLSAAWRLHGQEVTILGNQRVIATYRCGHVAASGIRHVLGLCGAPPSAQGWADSTH